MTEPAAPQQIRYLGDVQRLMLEPGDALVLSTPDYMHADSIEQMRARLGSLFPGRVCVILTEGVKLGVLARPDGASLESKVDAVDQKLDALISMLADEEDVPETDLDEVHVIKERDQGQSLG